MTEKEFINEITASYKAIIKSGDPFLNMYNRIQDTGGKKDGSRLVQALKIDCKNTIKTMIFFGFALTFFGMALSMVTIALTPENTKKLLKIDSDVQWLAIVTAISLCIVGWQIISIKNLAKEKQFILDVIEVYQQNYENKLEETSINLCVQAEQSKQSKSQKNTGKKNKKSKKNKKKHK